MKNTHFCFGNISLTIIYRRTRRFLLAWNVNNFAIAMPVPTMPKAPRLSRDELEHIMLPFCFTLAPSWEQVSARCPFSLVIASAFIRHLQWDCTTYVLEDSSWFQISVSHSVPVSAQLLETQIDLQERHGDQIWFQSDMFVREDTPPKQIPWYSVIIFGIRAFRKIAKYQAPNIFVPCSCL